MMKLNLDSRLQAIYDEIMPCDCVVDVGTDHGKIPIKAVLDGKCNRAIATDISAPSLNKARLAAIKYDVTSKVDCRVGDGLVTINDGERDTLVIAGMGGLEIINILKGCGNRFNRYIMLPHRNTLQLRAHLELCGLYPESDYMIECNDKFYNLLVTTDGACAPSTFELKYGKSRNTPIFRAFLTKEIAKAQTMLSKDLSQSVAINKLLELNELKEMYESITNC